MERETLLEELAQLEANFCSALSDPTRLLLLYTLHESPRTVTELCAELRLPQPKVSRHLKILREHGLVQPVRQGTSITYYLVDSRLIQALNLLRAVMRERIAYQAFMIHSISSSIEESV